MNDGDTIVLSDYLGRQVRLTRERQHHILEHQEMSEQMERIRETLADPESVVQTTADKTVVVYHRYYLSTPVTRKLLLVVVKHQNGDSFVLTAFFSNHQKKGRLVWPR